VKEKNDWVFDVITVMVKDKFIPKHSSDKVIFVSESIKLKNLIKENASLEDIKKILKSSGIPAIKTTQTGLHGSPKYVERKGYYFSNDIVSKSVVIKFREQWPETKNWIKILSKKLKENDIEFFKDKDSIGVYYN